MKCFEKVIRRITVMLMPYSLVSCSTGVSRLPAGQLPYHPVGCFNETVCSIIYFRVFVDGLPYLGYHPFRGYLTAVTFQKLFASLFSYCVKPVGLILGGVMLPQLDPCIGPAPELIKETERCTICLNRQYRACGEVYTHTHHPVRCHHRHLHDPRDGYTEHIEIILWMLQSPVHTKRSTVRKLLVHDSVSVFVNSNSYLFTCCSINQDRSP